MRLLFAAAALLMLPMQSPASGRPLALAEQAASEASIQPTIRVGTLTLKRCVAQYDGYCGHVTVPFDRHGAQPGSITVGFEFYPRTQSGHADGVILAQEGGPGYSTTGSRDGYVRMLAPLRTTHDLLLVDKRGTGRSSALDCPALQQAYQPRPADVAACAKQLGQRAWLYRSADAADDVAEVIAKLGYTKADFYGDSYGTWFGQVLAVTHPGLLRTIVLDSAYPVLRDDSNSEVNHGQAAMDIACRRSAPCAALGGSATRRFAALLASLRVSPIRGTAPGANGDPRQVTVDPAGLFLIVANAGNAPTAWRDLDAAGRAWTDRADGAPLLRLVAEARDGSAGGGAARDFSVALADAVICAEYPAGFDLAADFATRRAQYRAMLADLRRNHPKTYAPFTIDDSVNSQMDAEGFDTCLAWPKPPVGVPQAQPIAPGAVFPRVPVLVLSGELDTVTSPSEGRATAALFPNARFLQTPNLVHESAIGAGGGFVPPFGGDLALCVAPIVRNFIASGGNTGDTGCLARIRPVRTVPAFATRFADAAPAAALPGNRADPIGLTLASAATEAIGDVIARYNVTTSGHGAGLRGGGFDLSSTDTGYAFVLSDVRWAQDLGVSGTIAWNQLTGAIEADVSLGADGHAGMLNVRWNDRQTDAVARISGVVDGRTLSASRRAP